MEGGFGAEILGGAAAGMAVDLSLFPLDTIKTRLQSKQGFWKAGGYRGIYSGIGSVVVGSAPTAAMFFCTYSAVKMVGQNHLLEQWHPLVHSIAASCGEVTACLIRVPVEVVKQRAQTTHSSSSLSMLKSTIKAEGIPGLFRGYVSTVVREMPFSFLQFPIWEYLKKSWSNIQNRPVDPWQSSVCGAVAGCVASGITTPLDVAKTRIMLAKSGSTLANGSIGYALKLVYSEKGVRGLFAGILPRMMWISLGGAIFLGVYDKVKLSYQELQNVGS